MPRIVTIFSLNRLITGTATMTMIKKISSSASISLTDSLANAIPISMDAVAKFKNREINAARHPAQTTKFPMFNFFLKCPLGIAGCLG